MNVSDILKVVLVGVEARDHASVLDALMARLMAASGVKSTEKMICDLRDHESMEGVLAGTGCAVFHCLSAEVSSPVAAVAISRKNIQHPAKKRRVRIFFLIVSPMTESGEHLQTLSKIEGLMRDHALQHALLRARDEKDVIREIRKSEGSARSFYIPLSKEEVFAELETSEKGLTGEEAARRLKAVGPNTIKRIERGILLKDFLHNMFLNLFAVLLWAGGGMAFVAGMPELGWAIFLVIVINALFSFWQEYKAEAAVEALKKLLPKKVRVVREGAEREIEAVELVPGDLVKLSEGDGVPADGRLIEAEDMRVDNSALTGESRPVYKVAEPLADGEGFIWTEVPNLVFAGTVAVSGEAAMVVTATGMHTEIGKVAYLTQAIKPEMSPLQKEIVGITKVVTLLAAALGVIFFFLGYWAAGLTLSVSFIFAIGIIVANVPEGLLPTVSLSLAMGVQRMARKNAIVKKLSAVETLGSATVICTDKTGTLTQNQMFVTRLFVNGKLIEVTGAGYDPKGTFFYNNEPLSKDDLKKDGVALALAAGALCNNAALRPPSNGSMHWTVSGDPTEGAIITAAEKAGLRMDALKGSLPRLSQIPFERIRKRMTTVHEVHIMDGLSEILPPGLSVSPGSAITFVKGAPKELTTLCTGIYLDGEVKVLTDEERVGILRQNDLMAERGLRILGVAFREAPIETAEAGGKINAKAEELETGLTFLGLIAMLDPPRPEVKHAIAECRSAGIRVVMLTGDYGLTARAIAEQVGLAGNPRVITGEELNSMSPASLKDALKTGEVIFARVEPKDKLRVVGALQELGEVVAVTGDGVNDAPALKKADIGVAMGLRGSDAAKEAADMVLADDNFASIVDAVKEGRAVYANIKKFVTYIFASNIPEIIPFIAFVLFKIPLPLAVLQILAVDLGTDIFPALGLGVEPPEADIMKRKPRPQHKKLLDWSLIARAYLFLGMIEAVLSLGGFFLLYWMRGWRPGEALPADGTVYAAATTMVFAGIVASQIGNVFACRTEGESVFKAGVFKNRFIIASVFVEVLILLTLVYFPPLQRGFGFSPLHLNEWAILFAFPVIMLGAEEIRKAVMREA